MSIAPKRVEANKKQPGLRWTFQTRFLVAQERFPLGEATEKIPCRLECPTILWKFGPWHTWHPAVARPRGRDKNSVDSTKAVPDLSVFSSSSLSIFSAMGHVCKVEQEWRIGLDVMRRE